MAADWTTFKSNVKDFMMNDKNKTSSTLADKISTEYDNAILKSTTINTNTIIGGNNKTLIKDAFKAAFIMMSKSPIDLELKPYTLIALSIVDYWKSIQINPNPPILPDKTATIGYTITFTGLAKPLDEGLMKAFKSGKDLKTPEQGIDIVLENLVIAFSTHMLLISGTYDGLLPTDPPSPGTPIPWTGLI